MESLDILQLYYSWGAWLIVLVIIAGLIGLVAYAANAYFVSTALKKIGYVNSWYVWIPFLSSYAIADLVKDRGDGLIEIYGFRFEIKLFKFYWLIPMMITGFSIWFLPVGSILGLIINAVCGSMAYSIIYKCYENVNENDPVYKVLCLASGVLPIIPMIKCIMYYTRQPLSNLNNTSSTSYTRTSPIVQDSELSGDVSIDGVPTPQPTVKKQVEDTVIDFGTSTTKVEEPVMVEQPVVETLDDDLFAADTSSSVEETPTTSVDDEAPLF